MDSGSYDLPPPLPLNGPFFGPFYVKKNLNGLSVILDPPSVMSGDVVLLLSGSIYIYQSYAMKTMRSSGSSTHPVPALQTNH